MYLFGGQDPATGLAFNDLMVLDPDNWEWSAVELQSRPPARHSHAAGPLEDNALVRCVCALHYGSSSLLTWLLLLG